jgi:hypothetical protein
MAQLRFRKTRASAVRISSHDSMKTPSWMKHRSRRMNALRLVLLPLVAVMACSNACAATLSDADIAQVRAQMETRRLAVLRWEATVRFQVRTAISPAERSASWVELNQALALLYLGTEANRIATANSEIAEAVAALPNAPDFNTDSQEGDPGGLGAEHQPFYFMRASLLYHAVKLFGGGGVKSPGCPHTVQPGRHRRVVLDLGRRPMPVERCGSRSSVGLGEREHRRTTRRYVLAGGRPFSRRSALCGAKLPGWVNGSCAIRRLDRFSQILHSRAGKDGG